MPDIELPRWVWDLVMDLQQQEYEHPKLHTDRTHFGEGFVPAEWCPGEALKLVPAEVLASAKAIAAYRRVDA